MRVLVTGGTGFVGSHLVRRLLSSGHAVTSLDKNRGLFHDELEQLGATLVSGSVADVGAVETAMNGQELVYNLASPFGDPREPYQAFWDTEVQGTHNVLEAARRQDVQRVVHCSTQGVHGIVGATPG